MKHKHQEHQEHHEHSRHQTHAGHSRHDKHAEHSKHGSHHKALHHSHHEHHVDRREATHVEPPPPIDSFKKPEKNWGIFEFLRPRDTVERTVAPAGYYPGVSIAKGTFQRPSPAELAIMKMEGYHDVPTFDGYHSYDISYGVPVEGRFTKYKLPITPEQGFALMQEQIGKKIGEMKQAFGPNLEKLPPHKVDALLSFCYNIDVSHEKMGSVIGAVRSGRTEEVGELLGDYCHAKHAVRHHKKHHTYYTLESEVVPGLVNRRELETSLWNNHTVAYVDKLSTWHGLDASERQQCLSYYGTNHPERVVLQETAKPSTHHYDAKKPTELAMLNPTHLRR